jgi:hypothetical protein
MDETTPIVKRLNIIQESITGLTMILGTQLAQAGKQPLNIVISQSEADQRELERTTGEVRYPYASMSISNIHKNHDNNYNDVLRRNGVSVRGPANLGVNYIYKLIPISVSLNFRYRCTDFNDMLEFSQNWMLSDKKVQFVIKNNLFKIYIRVKLSDDLPLGMQEFTDYGQIFGIDTSLELFTYCGDMDEVRQLKTISYSVGLGTALPSQPNLPSQAFVAPTPQIQNVVTMENFSYTPPPPTN